MFGLKKLKWMSFFAALCLMLTYYSSVGQTKKKEGWSDTAWKALKYTGIAAGAVGTVTAAPAVLGAAGFTSAGIAAGSLAAKMFSVTAIANGGAVPAASLVAALQSAGAAGIGAAANGIIGTAGAGAGYVFSKIFGSKGP